MFHKDPIVIVGISRTPQGKFLGQLKDISATQLGAHAISSALKNAALSPDIMDEVFMGCVLSAGLGQAPARQAALGAGLSEKTPCTTLNKVCGSGMKAVLLAHDLLLLNEGIIVAGGMESMSNAPYLLKKARTGYRLGHGELLDHLMLDGLEDAYDKGKPMGFFAEQCVTAYSLTREQQDQFALTSIERARKATEAGIFAKEISPINSVDRDEHPFSINLEKIPKLNPIFSKEGTITPASSSSIADGAAALILMRLSTAEKNHLTPLAKIIGHADYANKPALFPIAPIYAIKKLLTKINRSIHQIDLFEINEAFAAVAMIAMKDLKIPPEKLNIHGSGCALGHPIGATGARIIVTLISALQHYQLKTGVAALCIGGGEATAIALERFE